MANVGENKSANDRIITATSGKKIIVEGQPDKYMYIILAGRAYMYTGHGTPEEKLIDKYGPGSSFGTFGMLTKKADIYTVVAQTDMKMIRLAEEDIPDFFRDNENNVMHIMKSMATDMIRMKTQISELTKDLTDRKRKAGEYPEEPESIILKDNSGTHRIYNPKNPHFDAKGKMRFLGRDK